MSTSHEPESILRAIDPPPDGTTTGDFMQPKEKEQTDVGSNNADTLALPTQAQRTRMARGSDQTEISQQEIEQTVGQDDQSEENATEGDIPLPAGHRQDDAPGHDDLDSTEDLLRADMVNAGD